VEALSPNWHPWVGSSERFCGEICLATRLVLFLTIDLSRPGFSKPHRSVIFYCIPVPLSDSREIPSSWLPTVLNQIGWTVIFPRLEAILYREKRVCNWRGVSAVENHPSLWMDMRFQARGFLAWEQESQQIASQSNRVAMRRGSIRPPGLLLRVTWNPAGCQMSISLRSWALWSLDGWHVNSVNLAVVVVPYLDSRDRLRLLFQTWRRSCTVHDERGAWSGDFKNLCLSSPMIQHPPSIVYSSWEQPLPNFASIALINRDSLDRKSLHFVSDS
jgi:hypothetical protein